MRERFKQGVSFVRNWFQPHRRGAVIALLKSAVLMVSLWEVVWSGHLHYYSRRYSEMPLSLAWSMLTVIGAIIVMQMGCSAALKLRSTRLRRLSAASKARLNVLLSAYITTGDSEEELRASAKATPRDFEECLTAALLGTRGRSLDRLRELPGVTGLREYWAQKSRKGRTLDRRYAVEHLALLRDPEAIVALELALKDPDAGVEASATRGLLRIPSYAGRDQLIRSLPGRRYLVRVLTAGEDQVQAGQADEMAEDSQETFARLIIAAEAATRAFGRSRKAEYARSKLLQSRPAIQSGRRDPKRESCATVATLGTSGQDLLRLMASVGLAGEAPAEALGEVLTANARGGRG